MCPGAEARENRWSRSVACFLLHTRFLFPEIKRADFGSHHSRRGGEHADGNRKPTIPVFVAGSRELDSYSSDVIDALGMFISRLKI